MSVVSQRMKQLSVGLGMTALLIAGFGATASKAEARVFFGFGFGLPIFGYGYGYPFPPAYYYPPPIYYAPPAPVYQTAPTTYFSRANSAVPSSDCRQYQSTQSIGGTPQRVVGTACRQADGTWRIVN